MQVSTRALVFSALKYGEADLIVTCFTEDYGLKTYLLRAILKSKKGKLRTSLFQPLTQLHINAFHKDKGTLERIKEATVSYPYQTLHTEVVKSSMVLFIAEMLKNCIQEEEANPELFHYIASALKWLDTQEQIAHFHLLFLLKLTAYLGIQPDPSQKELPYFNLAEGNFQAQPFGEYSFSGEAVGVLKGLFGINFDSLQEIKTTKKQRFEALNLLLLYYQLHLQGYKKPKSLLVLNQLFK